MERPLQIQAPSKLSLRRSVAHTDAGDSRKESGEKADEVFILFWFPK